MGFMRKQMLLQQKASLELTLQERMSYLSRKGDQPSKPGKDTVVMKLQADIEAVNKRLRAVDDSDRKAGEKVRAEVKRARIPRTLA